MRFFSDFSDYLKANFIICIVMYSIGNFIGTYYAYSSLVKDCSVMNSFRVDEKVFSCERVNKNFK